MTPASLRRSIRVEVDPATAFRVFTEQMDAWHVRGPHAFHDPARAVGITLEARQGGRWLEVWDAGTGEGYEIGRVLAWEPPARLVLSYRHAGLPPSPLTEVEVRFEPVDGGTRVVLEHRGFDRLPPDVVARWLTPRAWAALLASYRQYVAAAANAR